MATAFEEAHQLLTLILFPSLAFLPVQPAFAPAAPRLERVKLDGTAPNLRFNQGGSKPNLCASASVSAGMAMQQQPRGLGAALSCMRR